MKNFHTSSNPLKKAVLNIIEFYRSHISPHKPPCCRFTPTCSAYTVEAVEKYGVFKGLALGMKRLLRCNPFHKGGYDPVP